MPDTALDLVRAAAGHDLMGEGSLLDRAATGGTTTTLIDSGLITFANDQTLKNRWVYLWSGDNAGQERYAHTVAGDTGTLTWANALSNAVASGDQYLLLRDFRFSDWLALANETVKSLYYDKEVYLRGQTDHYRYTLPSPFSHRDWVETVHVGDYPFSFGRPSPASVRWHRLNPLNIAGDLYLLLEATLDASQQLVFSGRVPYLHPHLSAYTMTRSVLTPFGESTAISVPRHLVVAGMVFRALRRKVRNLTGQARADWMSNAQAAARAYAQACSEHGVRLVGRELGFSLPY